MDMNISPIKNKELPEAWDYDESVKKVKSLSYKWKNITNEIMHEIWTAHYILSPAVQNGTTGRFETKGKTWASYCIDIGIGRTTAWNWLQSYDSELRKIKPPEPKKTPEQVEAYNRETERIEREFTEHVEQKRPEDHKHSSADPIKDLFDRIMSASKESDLNLDDVRDDVKQKGIFRVLEEHVYGFGTISQQLEAVHNLIKKLRLIAVDLHKKTITEGD